MKQLAIFCIMWTMVIIVGMLVENHWKKKKERTGWQEKSTKEQWILSLVTNFFFAFTVLVFAPFELFLMNPSDFSYSFYEFWWVVVGTALLYLLFSFGISVVLRKYLLDYFILGIFSFTFCAYLQVMLLNGAMRSLTGEKIVWSGYLIGGNLALWFLVPAVFWWIKVKYPSFFRKLILFIALSLSLMQLVALISLLTTKELKSEQVVGYLSKEGMFELSENENAVVFVLDTFDGRTMDKLLEEEPDYLEPLAGFTYFPDATSVYSRTYPSIPYLLTGSSCYFDKPPITYVDKAYEESRFLSDMAENGTELGIYTYGEYIGEAIKPYISNYAFTKPELDMLRIERNMLQMALYRDMPYFVKQYIQYDIDKINNLAVKVPEGSALEKFRTSNDEWFAKELEAGLHTADTKGKFSFYHLHSCHSNLTDPIPAGKYSLEIVYDYIGQMQELGIYEDATIIVTTDHGASGAGDTLDMPHQTAVPIMFVKPAGVGADTKLRISQAPVSQADLFATVLAEFGLEAEDGRNIFEIEENEERERYYYYTALYSDESGEVELREYLVNGDARLPESYQFTGNKWDVQFSFNRVSKDNRKN